MSPSRISTHKIYPVEAVPLEILSQLKITNPEYTKAVKRGTSTARIPQYIDLWFEKDGEIYIPRSLDIGIPIEQDLRAKGHKVDFTFKGTLRPHQIPAVEDLTKAEGGILQAGCGCGKGHTLDTIIYTPEGKTTIGELKVGDKVIGSNGEAITVTGVYDRGVIDTYKVTFSDGTYLYCDGEHLFTVQHYRDRQKGNNKWVTKQVQELKDDLYYGGEGSNRSKWYIPLVKPVQFKEKPVPINAYLLGALIADGSLRREGMISFSNTEEDILRRIESFFPLNKKNDCDYDLKGGYVLKKDLEKLGLLGKKSYEKFIPDIYKYNAIEIRLALLQGLIDCDGEVDGTTVIYSTSSERLAKDVVEIVQSLGGIATIGQKTPTYTHNGEKRIGRTSYRVYIQLTNLLPFSSERHKKNYQQRTKYKEPFRNIKSIEYVGKRPIRCISVDAEDRLYVAEHFIVTHNTVMALAALANVGVTTLVLVHKEFLMNQWLERIQEFLGEEAGIIRGDTWDWKGRKIVIGMLQTLYSRREQVPDELLHYFGLTISDECLTYDSLVKTNIGVLPIGKIVEEKIQCEVLSYNEQTNQFEYKPITNWFKQGEKEVIRLTFDNGKTLECTYDHPILTRNRGWIPAGELTEEDDIVEG